MFTRLVSYDISQMGEATGARRLGSAFQKTCAPNGFGLIILVKLVEDS